MFLLVNDAMCLFPCWLVHLADQDACFGFLLGAGFDQLRLKKIMI